MGLPLLHLAGFLLAFVAGGLVAVNLGGRRMARPRKPAAPGPLPAAEPEAALVPARSELPTPPKASGLVFGHEMKNYLCAIRGNARLLRMGSQDKDQAAIIDRIDQVIARMESIDWKDEAAPDMIAPASRESVDLRAVAEGCARLHFAASKVDFRFECDAQAQVEGDAGRLEQVFHNLYGNAAEAGASRLQTRIRRAGNGLEVTIEDDGRGCAREALRRIFEPFYSTKMVSQPGACRAGAVRGLGLFIVQSIVENHKGRVRASSKNGRGDGATGLVIHLYFPIPASVPRGIPAPVAADPVPSPEIFFQTHGAW